MTKSFFPEGIFSWSQFSLWRSSPKGYKSRYFMKGPDLNTPEIRFGKYIATMLEKDPENPLIKHVPRYQKPEHEIKVTIRGVNIKGQLDTFNPENYSFREYKTGVEPWDDVRVRKHKQLTFYAMMINAKHGMFNIRTHLDWIPTELIKTEADERGILWEVRGKKLRLTGKVESFERVIERWELENLEKEVLIVAGEISAAYREFLTSEEI